MDGIAENKEQALRSHLASMSEVMVAFSAGVDSTYLLAVAHQELGDRVSAVTADSPSLARTSLDEAVQFCREYNIRHHVIKTDEFEQEAYLANDGNRCYHCKAALMKAMHGLVTATAPERGSVALVIGAIADDLGDHRPGMIAAKAAGAQWPLADLGFSKHDVRERSRVLGLSTWNRPAEPCLSSRIPYGERVTVNSLRMIEQAEKIIKSIGFPICRARHHQLDNTQHFRCRVEVPLADIPRLEHVREKLNTALLAIGYESVTIDPDGFKSGGFNALLSTTSTQAPT